MSDHERIWLQHPDDEDDSVGRLWCEDKVFDENDNEPTEYVRADIADEWKARAEKAEAEAEHQRKEVAYWHKRYAEVCMSTGRQGMWPDWGDSPDGFDGPGGAE